MTTDFEFIHCDGPGCEAKIKNDRWAKTKSHPAWFHSKTSGESFCSEHIPEWVEEWRARKAAEGKVSKTAAMDSYEWYPVERVTEPHGTYVQVFKGYWWLTNPEGQIALYRWRGGLTPQCNMNEDVSRKLALQLGDEYTVTQLPLAFMTINLSDYRY